MTFYTINPDAENPTSRDNTVTIRQTGQLEGTATPNTVNTQTEDKTMGGKQARVVNNLELGLENTLDQNVATNTTLERELYNSIDNGRNQMMIPIKGPEADALQRSPQTQAYYEEVVAPEAERVAHKNNAQFGVTEVDGTTYATITPTEESQANKYDTIRGTSVAFRAYQAGMSNDAVTENLKKYGYDDADIEEINRRVNVMTKAVEAGMSVDDVMTKMRQMQPTADTTVSQPKKPSFYQRVDERIAAHKETRKENAYNKLVDTSEPLTADELVSSLKILKPTMTSDTMTTIPAFFGNEEARQRYDEARAASRERIQQIAKQDYNIDLVWAPGDGISEKWYVQTPDGQVEVTPGFWQDMRKNVGEFSAGVGGAIAGAKTGARFGATIAAALGFAGPQAAVPEEVVTVPLASAISGAAGAVGGGVLGAMVGSQFDYLLQAMQMDMDMEAEAMAYRAMNAGEIAVVGEAIGYPFAKLMGVGWNAVVAAKNHILGGDSRAAYRAIKEVTFLNDDQINELVTNLEKHATLEGNKFEKGIQAIALTEPGMQDLVKAAGGTNPIAGAAATQTIFTRAEDVLAQTAALTDEQVPRMLSQDLLNYTTRVKENYDKVKAKATQAPKGLNFEWDFNELAISPVLEDLSTKIVDPTVKEKFLNQMQRVNAMSESHTFGDLVELRQMVNGFLYNSRITKYDDKATIRGVLNKIDDAIEQGAGEVLEDSETWLKEWADARSSYSEMKRVEKNAFYRSIMNSDGTMRALQPQQVVDRVTKYLTALDGSFEEVMSKLPIEGRKLYEGAVVESLTRKYTAGIEKGIKAIHFPMLAEQLKGLMLTTPDARAAKQALLEMAEVFKNDVYLAQAASKITIPKFQSFLTADPGTRAKFAIATGIFNYIQSKAPTVQGRQIALVRTAAKLLQKPLDVKAFKDLTTEVFDDANLTQSILDLQQAASKNRMKEVDIGTPKVKVYSGGRLKGTGSSQQIPLHRIATVEQTREIAEREAITLDSPALDAILQKYGYKAVLTGSDQVRVLGE